MDFINKIVIVTGASAGIGAETALMFAKQQATVVLVGRNNETLQENAEKCEQYHGIKPLILKTDLTNDQDVKKIVTKTIEKFGRIDILVNNAGIAVLADITDGIEPYDKVMNTNLRSIYLLTSLAIPYIIESKGNIVNVSSVASMKPIKEFKFLPYSMSKAALDNFTKYLAMDVSRHGVRVNSVNPGATNTRFGVHAGLSESEACIGYGEYAKSLPLRKNAETHEVGDLILFLASERATSITGSIFVIDNGDLLK